MAQDKPAQKMRGKVQHQATGGWTTDGPPHSKEKKNPRCISRSFKTVHRNKLHQYVAGNITRSRRSRKVRADSQCLVFWRWARAQDNHSPRWRCNHLKTAGHAQESRRKAGRRINHRERQQYQATGHAGQRCHGKLAKEDPLTQRSQYQRLGAQKRQQDKNHACKDHETQHPTPDLAHVSHHEEKIKRKIHAYEDHQEGTQGSKPRWQYFKKRQSTNKEQK